MTTLNKFVLGLLGVAMFTACEEDDSNPGQNPNEPVQVQFLADFSLNESSEMEEVPLQFSRDAMKDGVIVLSVTTDFAENFFTIPAIQNNEIEIEVEKGDEGAVFSFGPIDNEVTDGARLTTFSVKEVSEGFRKGTKTTLQVTINDDEVPTQLVVAQFDTAIDSIMENHGNSRQVKIRFPQASPAGKLLIRQTGNTNNMLALTSPPANNEGIIELPFSEGTTETWFTIFPYDDELLKGNKTVSFEILNSEGVSAGAIKNQSMKIIDDELRGKAKSFESFGGGWSAKNTYEYDELGRIAKVHWENRTPGYRGGTLTYTYASNGLVQNVNHHEGKDVKYIQANGKIVRSETISWGEMVAYSIYDYDPAGNVGGKAVYHKQPTGEFLMTDIYVYLHFDNGNLYKTLNYAPGVNGAEPELRSETTYEHYIGINNPFPLMELLPNINSQPNWPTSYQMVGNGQNTLYNFSYELNEAGQPARRTVSGTSEYTVYKYY